MDSTQPIGIFDSGIGGLTVVRALTETFPHENILYFGDTARVPYGTKSPQVVREYAAQDVGVLVSRGVKMVVIACNTVSSVAIEVVQRHSGVPVVGVIQPGAEAAVKASASKRIGVIGTRGTINSNAYTNAVRLLDRNAEVFAQACPLFVPLAEEGWITHPATTAIAKEYLFPLRLKRIDTLILGCTHYPILRDVIAREMDGITLVDSGEATAVNVGEVLANEGLLNTSPDRANLQFLVSDLPDKFTEVGERFLGRKLGRVRKVAGF